MLLFNSKLDNSISGTKENISLAINSIIKARSLIESTPEMTLSQIIQVLMDNGNPEIETADSVRDTFNNWPKRADGSRSKSTGKTTWCSKRGILDSNLCLTELARKYKDGVLSYEEYNIILLSKIWISDEKTPAIFTNALYVLSLVDKIDTSFADSFLSAYNKATSSNHVKTDFHSAELQQFSSIVTAAGFETSRNSSHLRDVISSWGCCFNNLSKPFYGTGKFPDFLNNSDMSSYVGNFENGIFELAFDNPEKFNEMYPDINVNRIDNRPFPLQQIYYGAPGTGKSFAIDKDTNESNRIRTTFHPDYDYATFVGAYKPTVKSVDRYGLFGKDSVKMKYENGTEIKDDVIVYKFIPQAFIKAYVEAWKRYADAECTDKDFYLVIEEINRGNCAQIFGDLFQLLDRTSAGFSAYAVETESDLQNFLTTDEKYKLDIVLTEDIKNDNGKVIATADNVKNGKVLVLPPNLHIWATMNTSDQSLFPIDSAFKRRWDWEYVPIKYDNTEWKVVLKDGSWCKWTELQQVLNDLIYDATDSEDKMLGDWFVKADNNEISEDILVGKIIFYLWNDVAKVDAGKLFDVEVEKRGRKRKVIFSDFYKVDGQVNSDIVAKWLKNTEVTINEKNTLSETPQEVLTPSDTAKIKPEYARILDRIRTRCGEQNIKYRDFPNSIDIAIGNYPFSNVCVSVSLNNTGTPSADVKLWIEVTPKSIDTRNKLRINGAEAFFEELASESNNCNWEELAKNVPDNESKVRGWRLRTTNITFREEGVETDVDWLFAKAMLIRERFATALD